MRIITDIEVLTTIEELIDPSRTAVMVIDMQNNIVRNISSNEGDVDPKASASLDNLTRIIPSIQRLLAAARSVGLPILYAEFIHRNKLGASLMDGPNQYCHRKAREVASLVEGTWEAQTVEELAPREGDIVFRKSRGSAMYHTMLDDVLKARGIRSLILTGCLTSGCVLFTAVDAMNYGYYPVVLRDCIGNYDVEDHNRALNWMETKFPVFYLDEILTAWQTMG